MEVLGDPRDVQEKARPVEVLEDPRDLQEKAHTAEVLEDMRRFIGLTADSKRFAQDLGAVAQRAGIAACDVPALSFEQKVKLALGTLM